MQKSTKTDISNEETEEIYEKVGEILKRGELEVDFLFFLSCQ